MIYSCTRLHWIWLCRLTKVISSKKKESKSPDEQCVHDDDSLVCEGPFLEQQLQNRFCKWDWGLRRDRKPLPSLLSFAWGGDGTSNTATPVNMGDKLMNFCSGEP